MTNAVPNLLSKKKKKPGYFLMFCCYIIWFSLIFWFFVRVLLVLQHQSNRKKRKEIPVQVHRGVSSHGQPFWHSYGQVTGECGLIKPFQEWGRNIHSGWRYFSSICSKSGKTLYKKKKLCVCACYVNVRACVCAFPLLSLCSQNEKKIILYHPRNCNFWMTMMTTWNFANDMHYINLMQLWKNYLIISL